MQIHRALSIVPPDAAVRAECQSGRYGGAWMILVTLPDGHERPLTQFADPFRAARWVNEYHRQRPSDPSVEGVIRGRALRRTPVTSDHL